MADGWSARGALSESASADCELQLLKNAHRLAIECTAVQR